MIISPARGPPMAAKKVQAKKTEAGTRKRLSDEQKQQIVNASADMTLQAIADQVGTTITTVAKYRKAGIAKASKATSAVETKRAGASACPSTIAGIIADGTLRDSQKVKMIAAYYEVGAN